MSFVDLLRAPKRPTALSGQWPLDMPLVQFSPLAEDIWTLEDAFQGTVILGSTGSGKNKRFWPTPGAQVFEGRLWRPGAVRRHRRSEPMALVSEKRPADRKTGSFSQLIHPCALISWITKRQKSGVDFVENLVTLLCDAASVQRRSEATGSEAHFWLPQKQKLMRNAITY